MTLCMEFGGGHEVILFECCIFDEYLTTGTALFILFTLDASIYSASLISAIIFCRGFYNKLLVNDDHSYSPFAFHSTLLYWTYVEGNL